MIAGALNRLQAKVTSRFIHAHSFDAIEFREHRASRLRLLRFLARKIFPDEFFRLLDQVSLIFISTLLRFATFFALDEKRGIVSCVAGGSAILKLNDAVASAIQKITIVTDDYVSC